MNESSCTICQDFLLVQDTVACPCGHTFHSRCIAEWNRVNNNCPQCRKNFGNAKPFKLFFDTPDRDDDALDPAELKNKLCSLGTQINEKDTEIKQKQEKIKAAKREIKGMRLELGAVRDAWEKSETVNNILKRQLTFLEKHKEEAVKARISAQKLQKNLDDLQNIEDLIRGERHEVEALLKKFRDSPDSLNQIVTSFVIMKKEFEKLKESKSKLNQEKKAQRKELEELKRKLQASTGERKSMQDQLKLVETDLQHLEREKQSLQKKVCALEQAFNSPSPRSSAIKRLLKESPAPMAFKKARHSTEDSENSLEIDQNVLLTSPMSQPRFEDFESEGLKEMASEIGLKLINTTTLTAAQTSKSFLTESKKLFTLKSSAHAQSMSSCTVIQKGYNGLGGQGRFIKPAATKKLSSRVKIPKSTKGARTINQFLSSKNPALPNFQFSP